MRLFIILFISVVVLTPLVSFAAGLGFGGRVITSASTPIVCLGIGPITITPAGISPAALYATEPATLANKNYSITPSGYILGLYLPTLSPLCWVPVPPPGVPTPIYVFPIITYGSSH
jgi:hypothetical protein